MGTGSSVAIAGGVLVLALLMSKGLPEGSGGGGGGGGFGEGETKKEMAVADMLDPAGESQVFMDAPPQKPFVPVGGAKKVVSHPHIAQTDILRQDVVRLANTPGGGGRKKSSHSGTYIVASPVQSSHSGTAIVTTPKKLNWGHKGVKYTSG